MGNYVIGYDYSTDIKSLRDIGYELFPVREIILVENGYVTLIFPLGN